MLSELNTKILRRINQSLPSSDTTNSIAAAINFFKHQLRLDLIFKSQEIDVPYSYKITIEINGFTLGEAIDKKKKVAKEDASSKLLQTLNHFSKFYLIEVAKILYGKSNVGFTDNEKYLLEYLFHTKAENEVLMEEYSVKNYKLRNAPLRFTKIMSEKYSEHKKLITGYVSWQEELIECFNGHEDLTQLVLQYANVEREQDPLVFLKSSPIYEENVLDLILQYCLWNNEMARVLPLFLVDKVGSPCVKYSSAARQVQQGNIDKYSIGHLSLQEIKPESMSFAEKGAFNELLSALEIETMGGNYGRGFKSKPEQISSSALDPYPAFNLSFENTLRSRVNVDSKIFDGTSMWQAPTFSSTIARNSASDASSIFQIPEVRATAPLVLGRSDNFGHTSSVQEIIEKQRKEYEDKITIQTSSTNMEEGEKESTVANESSEAKMECAGNPNQLYNPPEEANSVLLLSDFGLTNDPDTTYSELGAASNMFDH